MAKVAHSGSADMDAIETQGRALEAQEMAVAPTGLELVVSKALNPIEVFTGNGLDSILERIEKETRSIALDISTPKGRKEVASLAHKVAQSKTALDKAGKDLVAGWKEQAKKVDLERARAWDRLEALQKEIRQPLTEWEDRDKNRIAAHEAALSELAGAGPFTLQNWQSLPVQAMQDRLAEIQNDKRDWQEFSAKAKQATEASIAAITSAIAKRQTHDAEQAELARLRKEEEERKQRAHEGKIRTEAAEKARLQAEEKARKEAEAEAKRVAAEKSKAESERQRVQREKEDAEARAAKAESDRIAAEQKAAREKALADERAAQAEQARIAAEKKAAEDARLAADKAAKDKKAAEEAAAERERARIAAEKKAEAEAAAKREADKEHRRKINTEAWHVLKNLVGNDGATNVIEAIAKGQIPHIKIAY